MTQARTSTQLSIKQAAARSGAVRSKLDTALFSALADPTRAALLACLIRCGRACSVGEVASCCVVDLSVVSRHLRALEAAGLLESRKTGRAVHYSVRYAEICAVLRGLADAIESCRPGGACCDEGGWCGC